MGVQRGSGSGSVCLCKHIPTRCPVARHRQGLTVCKVTSARANISLAASLTNSRTQKLTGPRDTLKEASPVTQSLSLLLSPLLPGRQSSPITPQALDQHLARCKRLFQTPRLCGCHSCLGSLSVPAALPRPSPAFGLAHPPTPPAPLPDGAGTLPPSPKPSAHQLRDPEVLGGETIYVFSTCCISSSARRTRMLRGRTRLP